VYYHDREDPYVFIEASDTEICDVRVKTHPAKLYLSKKEDVTSAITWALDDGTLLYISGYFSESELLMMAESVRRIDYLPAWNPEGYAEKSVRVFNDKTTVLYVNGSGELLRFSYVITNREYHWSFDVSQGETLDCRVGDQPGVLFRSHAEKTASAVTWIGADDTAFHVTGFVSEEDLLKMAESVQRIIYLPTWIPEGYAEKSVRVFNDKTTVLYVNDSGELVRFSYVITNRDYNWSFDFSQGETVDCPVGDQPGTLFRSHAEKTAGAVTWIGADGTAFFVTGFISEEDLIRMAESVN
jgi:hypothetical protein